MAAVHLADIIHTGCGQCIHVGEHSRCHQSLCVGDAHTPRFQYVFYMVQWQCTSEQSDTCVRQRNQLSVGAGPRLVFNGDFQCCRTPVCAGTGYTNGSGAVSLSSFPFNGTVHCLVMYQKALACCLSRTGTSDHPTEMLPVVYRICAPPIPVRGPTLKKKFCSGSAPQCTANTGQNR